MHTLSPSGFIMSCSLLILSSHKTLDPSVDPSIRNMRLVKFVAENIWPLFGADRQKQDQL